MTGPIKSLRTLDLEAGGTGELPGLDGPPDDLVAAIRRFAQLGGCQWKEPCGCSNAQCLAFGGDATPGRCVECIESGRRPVKTP